MPEPVCPQKITFADMRAQGVRGLLIYALTISATIRLHRLAKAPPLPSPVGDNVIAMVR